MNFRNASDLLKVKLNETSMPEGVAGLYLYGSVLTGSLRYESDIDIAVLFAPGIGDPKKLQLFSKLESIITSFFKEPGLDREVSILDMRGRYVSVQLLYKIVTEGVLVYERNSAQRREFENAVRRDYFDFNPLPASLRERKHGHILQKT